MALHHPGASDVFGDVGQDLLWFGLLEYRCEKIPDSQFAALHYYRKAAMFDRLLSFDITTDTPSAIQH